MKTAKEYYEQTVAEQIEDQNFSANRIAIEAMEVYVNDLIVEAADIAFDYILHEKGAVESRKIQRAILNLIK